MLHNHPIRIIGPNNAKECLFNTSGEPMVDRCRRIDANTVARCNLWLTEDMYNRLELQDVQWIWEFGMAQTLNGTLLRRLLSVRHTWTRE